MPLDDTAQTFRDSIFPVIAALGDAALFQARYFIYDGGYWGCTHPSHPCGNQVPPEPPPSSLSRSCGDHVPFAPRLHASAVHYTCVCYRFFLHLRLCDLTPLVQCTNGGRYCSPDPDGDPDFGISGASVVKEDLRQMCLFRLANKTVATDYAAKYFRYTKLFSQNCNNAVTFSAECAEEQYVAAGLCTLPALSVLVLCPLKCYTPHVFPTTRLLC
jgi:hypothetical protein